MLLQFESQMKITHIKIQQTTIISINNRNSSQEIQQDIETKNNPSANQLSILSSTVDLLQLKPLTQNIQTVSIKKSTLINIVNSQLTGVNLRLVELSYCCLSVVPKINSNNLAKLNLSHNCIEQLLDIPHPQTLRILDMRDNRLNKVTADIYNLPTLQFIHEFLSSTILVGKITAKTDVEAIIKEDIWNWDNEKLINICQEAIQNNNDHIMKQLLIFLNESFIRMIFDTAIKKKKHKILDLLISQNMVANLTLEEKVLLLLPSLLPLKLLKQTPLQMIVKAISHAKTDSSKIKTFLQYSKQMSKQQSIFIQSEKDLINFMTFSLTHLHNFEAQFLQTQHVFLQSYDFYNQAVLKYLLQLDHLPLIKQLLTYPNFQEKIFSVYSYRQMIKSNTKLYKMLHKRSKQYYRQNMAISNTWFYPEYRERKSFCIKNDLYDYDVLKQYEEMQCSYRVKDFKYTLKFVNKQNEMSVAKKIGNQLRKSTIKSIKNNSRQLSVSSISLT